MPIPSGDVTKPHVISRTFDGWYDVGGKTWRDKNGVVWDKLDVLIGVGWKVVRGRRHMSMQDQISHPRFALVRLCAFARTHSPDIFELHTYALHGCEWLMFFEKIIEFCWILMIVRHRLGGLVNFDKNFWSNIVSTLCLVRLNPLAQIYLTFFKRKISLTCH